MGHTAKNVSSRTVFLRLLTVAMAVATASSARANPLPDPFKVLEALVCIEAVVVSFEAVVLMTVLGIGVLSAFAWSFLANLASFFLGVVMGIIMLGTTTHTLAVVFLVLTGVVTETLILSAVSIRHWIPQTPPEPSNGEVLKGPVFLKRVVYTSVVMNLTSIGLVTVLSMSSC
jgi:hypothetical protein